MPQMTAEKANLAKKIPSSPKKGTFFCRRNSLSSTLIDDLDELQRNQSPENKLRWKRE
jgi:hypothetical protein